MPPNGLAFSGGLECITLIDREDGIATSGCQNRPDPAASLQRHVSWQLCDKRLLNEELENSLYKLFCTSKQIFDFIFSWFSIFGVSTKVANISKPLYETPVWYIVNAC